MDDCPATYQAVVEAQATGDTGCPVCGEPAERHPYELTDSSLIADAYSMDRSEMRWRMRYEFGLAAAASDPRADYALPEQDLDRLPDPLGRLARELRDAPAGEPAREAAQKFLTASEEWLD